MVDKFNMHILREIIMDLVNYKNKSGFAKKIFILSFLIFLIISSTTSVTASQLKAKKNIFIFRREHLLKEFLLITLNALLYL